MDVKDRSDPPRVKAIPTAKARAGTSTLPTLTTILQTVDWDALPERSQKTVRKLAPMLCAGFSTREIAQHFNRSADWVAARIRELREDIVEQVIAND